MTDQAAILHALSAFHAASGTYSVLLRNGRVFMLLPADRHAALVTLSLYQPQRWKAAMTVVIVRMLILLGLHRLVLPKWQNGNDCVSTNRLFEGVKLGSVGLMLGSPEHRVRRAILTYECEGIQEVAKLALGHDGRKVIDAEATVLKKLPQVLSGKPQLMGLHESSEFTMLRMTFEKGQPIAMGDASEALDLLKAWRCSHQIVLASNFPEWKEICAALQAVNAGDDLIAELENQMLIPSVRHGDFARWNLLRRKNHSLVVLDWEWGSLNGMPGLDLVHFFLQDERLVNNLPHREALVTTCEKLRQQESEQYIRDCGWKGNLLLPVIASLAWKQGAGHQDNQEILDVAVQVFAENR